MTPNFTVDDRDKLVADEIKAGRCPFGMLKENQTTVVCPLGFPGCGCFDEMMINPHLVGERKQMDAKIGVGKMNQDRTLVEDTTTKQEEGVIPLCDYCDLGLTDLPCTCFDYYEDQDYVTL